MTVFSATVIVIGIYMGLANWVAAAIAKMRKRDQAALMPFAGMVVLLVGLLLYPGDDLDFLYWLIPVIDYTGLPMLLMALVRRRKAEPDQAAS